MTNRFIINGLVEEAARGKRVLYLTATQHEARAAMDEARRQGIPGGNFNTTPGHARIIIGRGHLDLRTTYGIRHLRGTIYDLVYLDPDAERTIRETDTLHELHATLGATQGEIITA